MGIIDDLLASVLTREQAPVSSAAVPAADQGTAVDGVTVTARPRPQPQAPIPMQAPRDVGPLQPPLNYQPDPSTPQTPQASGLNYNNSQAAGDVQSALAGEPALRGGSANPGIYGLLPQNLQHGTLRNVLGALGDAFLVGSGRQAVYRPRMENEEIGQAMAGMDINDPDSVAAAVQRVAATGAPGSVEMADKLQTQAEQAALRKQYMQYNQDYRQQVLGNQQERIDAQRAAIADRYRPQIGGMLQGVTDAGVYSQKYNSLVPLAKQLGGQDATPASVWSIPEPGNWTPGLTGDYGMTANNVQQTQDRAAQRAQSQTNAQISAGSRVTSAGMEAGSHVTAAQIGANKPDEATFMDQYIAAKRSGQQTTPEQDARYQHDTQVSRTARRPPPGSGASTQFTHVAVNPQTHQRMGWNGKQWVPF